MLKLKRVDEAKQVGILYHVCSLRSAVYNIEHDSITPSIAANKRNGKKTISFTRDKLYLVDTVSYTDPILVQFIIDGDKISENKKILPFAAFGYRDADTKEKEEIIENRLDNLKKVLKGINVLIDVDSIMEYTSKEFKILSKAVEYFKKNVSDVNVLCVSRSESANKTKYVKTNIPKDCDSFIKLCNRIMEYDSPSIIKALASVCDKFFSGKADIDEVIDKNNSLKNKITVMFTEDVIISDISKEINSLVEVVQEELGCKQIKCSKSSLSKILNDKKTMIDTLTIYPTYDYLYNKTPTISLSLVDQDVVYISFPN